VAVDDRAPYLQIQFLAGASSPTGTAPTEARAVGTETLAPRQFNPSRGFNASDWAHIPNIGLRIADSFGGYQEGRRYDIGPRPFVPGYGPLPAAGARAKVPATMQVDDGEKLLTVGSDPTAWS